MEDNPLGVICFWITAICLAFCLVDCGGGTSRTREAEVVDRSYMPAHIDSNGDYVHERYTLMVRSWGGFEEVTTSREGYYNIKPGQHISYRTREGWLTHHDWFPSY